MMKRIDFHTHILPQIDDGSSSINESIEMLQMLADSDVEAVFLTPHFYANRDYPAAFLKAREESFKTLQAAIQDKPFPKLLLGAEVAYFEGMSTCDEMKNFIMESTESLLIEFPFCDWSLRIFDNVLELASRLHVRPILAHMDRYRLRRKDMHLLEYFTEAGGILQSSADFFLARFSEKKALKLFEEGMIQVLCSDCHNTQSRAPRIGEAFDIIEQKASQASIEAFNQITNSILKIDK